MNKGSSRRPFAPAVAIFIVLGLLSAFQATAASGSDFVIIPAKINEQLPGDPFIPLAIEFPGFAGAYLDESDETIVIRRVVSHEIDLEATREFLRPFFPEHFQIRVVDAAFRYIDLTGWASRIWQELPSAGVALVGVSSESNQVVLGIYSDSLSQVVGTVLTRIGVPLDAVSIQPATPIIQHSLQGRHRPSLGGIKIYRPTAIPFFGYSCTLGFMAQRSSYTHGWVTNSHCSRRQGLVDNTSSDWWEQPTEDILTGLNVHGQEVVDPPLFTGSPCPSGEKCRYSDANLNNGVGTGPYQRGFIARTSFGTTSWNGTSKFRISGKLSTPGEGLFVNRVGQRTGRSQGPIRLTCAVVTVVDDNLVPTGITMLCQGIFAATSDKGDSGSPVFYVTNQPATHDVSLAGVAWGGGFLNGEQVVVYSDMSQVQKELGTLTVCASGFSC